MKQDNQKRVQNTRSKKFYFQITRKLAKESATYVLVTLKCGYICRQYRTKTVKLHANWQQNWLNKYMMLKDHGELVGPFKINGEKSLTQKNSMSDDH